jgi:hypothetical protein
VLVARVLTASGRQRPACTEEDQMSWVWTVGAAWVLLSVGLALLIGRSIGLADRKAADLTPDAPNFIVDRPPLAALPAAASATSGAQPADGSPSPSPFPAPRGTTDDPGHPGRPSPGRAPTGPPVDPTSQDRLGLTATPGHPRE